MIPQLASPSVCVIDDEAGDYRPILDALLGVGLGCVHVRGDALDSLPPKPFKGLRIVFTDLHLTAATGKDAASHAANVFKRVVAASSAPLVVVIWSKYAQDAANIPNVPPEDQPTEADQFKQLIQAEPGFEKRLIFLDMAKPKAVDRPDDNAWVAELKKQIENALQGLDAFAALWAWESLVNDASREVSATITEIAFSLLAPEDAKDDFAEPNNQLALLLKLLAQQQGGPDCAENTAARHLLTVLSHLGQDEIERSASGGSLDHHGSWLAEILNKELKKKCNTLKLNSILLTGQATPSFAHFSPGTVFDVTDLEACQSSAGLNCTRLIEDCNEKKLEEFKSNVKPVVIEITPSCDFHQGHRRSALLVGGIACPDSQLRNARMKDTCKSTPVFEDRFSDQSSNLSLIFCSRHRVTVNHDELPGWLKPRLRLREAIMADIRNWFGAQAARAGYLSF